MLSRDKIDMKKISLDTQIYISKLVEELESIKFFEFLEDSEELKNVDVFKTLLVDEISLQASINEIELGEPTLSEDQFDKLVNKCIIKDALDDLVEKGLIDENFDPSEMDTIYSLKNQTE